MRWREGCSEGRVGYMSDHTTAPLSSHTHNPIAGLLCQSPTNSTEQMQLFMKKSPFPPPLATGLRLPLALENMNLYNLGRLVVEVRIACSSSACGQVVVCTALYVQQCVPT